MKRSDFLSFEIGSSGNGHLAISDPPRRSAFQLLVRSHGYSCGAEPGPKVAVRLGAATRLVERGARGAGWPWVFSSVRRGGWVGRSVSVWHRAYP
jgi:hypothetical protein